MVTRKINKSKFLKKYRQSAPSSLHACFLHVQLPSRPRYRAGILRRNIFLYDINLQKVLFVVAVGYQAGPIIRSPSEGPHWEMYALSQNHDGHASCASDVVLLPDFCCHFAAILVHDVGVHIYNTPVVNRGRLSTLLQSLVNLSLSSPYSTHLLLFVSKAFWLPWSILYIVFCWCYLWLPFSAIYLFSCRVSYQAFHGYGDASILYSRCSSFKF